MPWSARSPTGAAWLSGGAARNTWSSRSGCVWWMVTRKSRHGIRRRARTSCSGWMRWTAWSRSGTGRSARRGGVSSPPCWMRAVRTGCTPTGPAGISIIIPGMSLSTAALIAIYADESCLGNGREGSNPGGAGGVIETQHPRTGELIRRDYWVSEPATTNNRMALWSAIEGLRRISTSGTRHDVAFVSDSRYLVDGMTSWVYDWARRGWRRKSGAIENLELWQELVRAARAHRVAWRWVRGHMGHPQNEYANM